ncbi:threonine dehydratase [Bradyrhizobium sp. USDA 4461]
MSELAINLDTINRALHSIRALVTRTPILTNSDLDERVGGHVYIKAENFQRTGSFKFRGATHRLSLLTPDERKQGVVAFSSGNHALALAEAGAHFGVPVVVIVPKNVPEIKLSAVRKRGAEVILFDRLTEDRYAIMNRIANDRGSIIVPPYDDPYIIAGQGTAAVEAVQQLDANGVTHIDQAVVCCGGGGLSTGCILVLKNKFPDLDFVTAEPADFDDMARSLASGKKETNELREGSICDAILSPSPGNLTLPILIKNGARGVSVTDGDVLEAMHFAATRFKMVTEPGGSAALAALISGAVDCKGKSTLVLTTGGNVDMQMLARAISWAPQRQ